MFEGAVGLLWGALFTLFLCAAAVIDVRSRRVPNTLVVALLAAGFAFSVTTRPFAAGLLTGLAGGALGFALFIAFWPMGLIGAGDVKLFTAIGVWLGPVPTLQAALVAVLIGGALALFTLVRSGELVNAVRRIGLAVAARSPGVLGHIESTETGKNAHVPYAVALAVGALVVAWLGPALAW